MFVTPPFLHSERKLLLLTFIELFINYFNFNKLLQVFLFTRLFFFFYLFMKLNTRYLFYLLLISKNLFIVI